MTARSLFDLEKKKKKRQPVGDVGLDLANEHVEQAAKANALTQLKINGRMNKTR